MELLTDLASLGSLPYGTAPFGLHPLCAQVSQTNPSRFQIPKPNEKEGLGIVWPASTPDMEKLKAYCEYIQAKM